MSENKIRLTETDIRRLAKQRYDKLVAMVGPDTKMTEEGWFQSGFLEGYAEATKDIRGAKEKVALANIKRKFPASCADNFKVDEEFKCHATGCLLNNMPEMAQLIKMQGCEVFFTKEVMEILRERGDERVYKLEQKADEYSKLQAEGGKDGV